MMNCIITGTLANVKKWNIVQGFSSTANTIYVSDTFFDKFQNHEISIYPFKDNEGVYRIIGNDANSSFDNKKANIKDENIYFIYYHYLKFLSKNYPGGNDGLMVAKYLKTVSSIVLISKGRAVDKDGDGIMLDYIPYPK